MVRNAKSEARVLARLRNIDLGHFLERLECLVARRVERGPAFLKGLFEGRPGLLPCLMVRFQLGFCGLSLRLQMGERCIDVFLLCSRKGAGFSVQGIERFLPGFALGFGPRLESSCNCLASCRVASRYF